MIQSTFDKERKVSDEALADTVIDTSRTRRASFPPFLFVDGPSSGQIDEGSFYNKRIKINLGSAIWTQMMCTLALFPCDDQSRLSGDWPIISMDAPCSVCRSLGLSIQVGGAFVLIVKLGYNYYHLLHHKFKFSYPWWKIDLRANEANSFLQSKWSCLHLTLFNSLFFISFESNILNWLKMRIGHSWLIGARILLSSLQIGGW